MDDESSVIMEPMVDFWGAELSGKQKKVKWPEFDESEPDVTVRLELRQACLGAKARPGERNVVELTTEDENGEEVTHSIVSLTVGGTEQSPLFLEVFPPVSFHLASGSGPLHIVGNMHTEFDEYDSDTEDDEDELSSPELTRSRKRAADSPPSKAAKTRKLVKENGDSMNTSVDHEEEEEEESEEEEDDSEESEEEEDEDEGAMEETKKTPNKPALVSKTKSKSAQKPQKSAGQKPLFKTPQQQLKGSKTGKITLSAPTTPEQIKSGKKAAKSTMSLEDMKEKLKKTPNLPKKLDKFGNYVQHNFKVSDEKVKKQLWEFAQKRRAVK